jgi:hypothetical protein
MSRSNGHPLIFHGCTEDESCKRLYDPSLGYYGGTNSCRVLCGIHFKALYVYIYDAHRHVRRYAWPVPGCENITEWHPAILDVQLD